jgi:hypothetical protein
MTKKESALVKICEPAAFAVGHVQAEVKRVRSRESEWYEHIGSRFEGWWCGMPH